MLSEPCFYHLQTIIVFQYRHSVWLRHIFTSYTYLKQRYSSVRIGTPSYIFSKNATIPSDIWSAGKGPIAMFEFATWHRTLQLQDYRVQEYTLLFPPSFKCNVLRGSLSVDSQNIPCATLKRRGSWVISGGPQELTCTSRSPLPRTPLPRRR